jgi:hypothetical protein
MPQTKPKIRQPKANQPRQVSPHRSRRLTNRNRFTMLNA